MFRRYAVLPFLILLSLLQPPTGSLAQATPELPMTPSAADCVQEPASTEHLRSIASDFLIPSQAADQTMTGETAPPETWEQVTGVLEGVIACANTGNVLSFFGAFTDNGLTSHFGLRAEEADTETVEQLINNLESAEVSPTPSIALVSVLNVATLDDGRIGALVVTIETNEETEAVPNIDYFVLDAASLAIDALYHDALNLYTALPLGPILIPRGCSGRCDCPAEMYGAACGMASPFETEFLGDQAESMARAMCGTRVEITATGVEIRDVCETPE